MIGSGHLLTFQTLENLMVVRALNQQYPDFVGESKSGILTSL